MLAIINQTTIKSKVMPAIKILSDKVDCKMIAKELVAITKEAKFFENEKNEIVFVSRNSTIKVANAIKLIAENLFGGATVESNKMRGLIIIK